MRFADETEIEVLRFFRPKQNHFSFSLMSQIVNVAATKQGLVYEDHHYKIDGRYERSPPSKLKGMYDYLPTEMVCRTPRAQTLSRECSSACWSCVLSTVSTCTGCNVGQAYSPEAFPVG